MLPSWSAATAQNTASSIAKIAKRNPRQRFDAWMLRVCIVQNQHLVEWTCFGCVYIHIPFASVKRTECTVHCAPHIYRKSIRCYRGTRSTVDLKWWYSSPNAQNVSCTFCVWSCSFWFGVCNFPPLFLGKHSVGIWIRTKKYSLDHCDVICQFNLIIDHWRWWKSEIDCIRTKWTHTFNATNSQSIRLGINRNYKEAIWKCVCHFPSKIVKSIFPVLSHAVQVLWMVWSHACHGEIIADRLTHYCIAFILITS